MFKKIAYLIVFLAVTGIFFSLIDRESEYPAERKLFFANKSFSLIIKSPETVPAALYKKIAGRYEEIILKYPNTPGAKQARLMLGRLYINEKKFAAAREELEKIIKNYPDNKNYCAEALFASGNAYEAEGKWQEALNTYENIMYNYTGTPRAMNLPLYIIAYLGQKKDHAAINTYITKARGYYKKIGEDYPNSALGYSALNLEILTLEMLKKWPEALEMLKNIINNYPNAYDLVRKMITIESIAVTKMNEPQKAADIYTNFINRNPNHKINQVLKRRIAALESKEKKKDKDVIQSAKPQE